MSVNICHFQSQQLLFFMSEHRLQQLQHLRLLRYLNLSLSPITTVSSILTLNFFLKCQQVDFFNILRLFFCGISLSCRILIHEIRNKPKGNSTVKIRISSNICYVLHAEYLQVLHSLADVHSNSKLIKKTATGCSFFHNCFDL